MYWQEDTFFDQNMTHNLGIMAEKAGIYQALWRPEEIGIKKASQLIKPLTEGLEKLKATPEYFKQFNPENGWGSYEGLVEVVEKYLRACKENPKTNIRVSR